MSSNGGDIGLVVSNVVRQLKLLASDFWSEYRTIVLVSQEKSSYFEGRRYIEISGTSIRLVKESKAAVSEVVFDTRTERLFERGREVSVGFLPSFGLEVVELIDLLGRKQAKLFLQSR